jgi:hypothetical protein
MALNTDMCDLGLTHIRFLESRLSGGVNGVDGHVCTIKRERQWLSCVELQHADMEAIVPSLCTMI